MSVIPTAAVAIANGFARYERASGTLIRAAAGANDADAAGAVAEQIEAKAQVRAGVSVVRFADEMWQALMEIGRR